MKKYIFASLAVALVAVLGAQFAHGRVKSYYSGDAIAYHGQTIVGSANSDRAQVFKLTSSGLEKIMDLQPVNERFGTKDNFYDLKFNIEDGGLYVYAISGFSLYKYDISNLSSPALVKKAGNTYWEWYSRIDKFGSDIVTISGKGIKVWNANLDVVDSYDLKNDIAYNIRSNGSSQYIFNITKDEIQVFDRQARKVVRTIAVNYRSANGNRNLYFDAYEGKVYVVDDLSAKKFDFNSGALEGRFEHSGNPGYDIASSDNDYIYFSNGLGVVKLKKADMSLVDSQETGGIAGPEGWAMGLKVISDNGGDKVVVFNNSSILVLDSQLKKLGAVTAEQGIDKPEAKENLFLKVSSPLSLSGSQVHVSGGGYFPNEKLTIAFAGNKYEVDADKDGRFANDLRIPDLDSVKQGALDKFYTQSGAAVEAGTTVSARGDIKVTGEQSKFTYSISMQIVDNKAVR